jgi:hypothetical protein
MFIGMKHSYSVGEFKKAVEESFSIAQIKINIRYLKL